MTNAKHTDTPWMIRTHNDGHQIWHEPGDGLRSMIANLNGFGICAEHGGDSLANAAHIVRCVNAMPDLVAALEAMIKANDHDTEAAALIQACNALAKVRP